MKTRGEMDPSLLQPGIFNNPRPKRSLLQTPNKRRKTEYKVEEISFDNEKRADYLTGFHKRKVARIKAAQVENAKKEREERIKVRKQLREERKQELEEHVEAVNRMLKEVENVGTGADLDSEEDAWGGIEDEKPVDVLDHEEEYMDEDRYTVVTVEAVDISKEGLRKVVDEDSDEAPDLVSEEKNGKEDTVKKKWPKKERKKKFRYESKAERKFTRTKQNAGNKAKADARKGS